MKTNKERIQEALKLLLWSLYRKLILEYPPYHWHHSKIFSTYWKLYDEILCEKEVRKYEYINNQNKCGKRSRNR